MNRQGRASVRRLLALSCSVLALLGTATATTAGAANPTPRWQGTWSGPLTQQAGSDSTGTWPARDYYTYTPPASVMPPAGQRSMIVYLHGTTQTATQAALASKWNDLADQKGFVVVYPEENDGGTFGASADGGNAARGWQWAQGLVDDRGSGEVRTIAKITRALTTTEGVDDRRVYVAGLSAGAIMAAVMAASYPDVYSGLASWAGCAYMCADPTGELGYQRMGNYRRPLPAIFFASETDYLDNAAMSLTAVSGWVGLDDLADDGQTNGSVSHTPTTGPTNYGADVGSLTPHPNTGPPDGSNGTLGACVYLNPAKGNNPCPGGPLGWSTYPYTVTRFGATAGTCSTEPARDSCIEVESVYIHGASHNYVGGGTEGTFGDPIGPDTTSMAWTFLSAHQTP